MNSYIVNFATYVFAMIGFIVLILFVYKKAMSTPMDAKNREFLNVENVLRLSPTKTVYIIKAGYERFLVAGDNTNTTLLAKLDENNINKALSVEEESK